MGRGGEWGVGEAEWEWDPTGRRVFLIFSAKCRSSWAQNRYPKSCPHPKLPPPRGGLWGGVVADPESNKPLAGCHIIKKFLWPFGCSRCRGLHLGGVNNRRGLAGERSRANRIGPAGVFAAAPSAGFRRCAAQCLCVRLRLCALWRFCTLW